MLSSPTGGVNWAIEDCVPKAMLGGVVKLVGICRDAISGQGKSQAGQSIDQAAVPHRVLHFLEGAYFNLAHTLARNAELVGDLFKRDWVLGEPARFENAPFAIVEHAERRGERLAAVV
jgi:hypothetical protein